MLVSATNYEALPGARPDGSMRIELFAMVAGVGPQGRDQGYSPQAVTFFFDVLSASLSPPQDWRELLAGSEELLTLSTGPVPGQRSLTEAVQLIGLPLAFEQRFHEEVEELSEPEWGGVGRGVEVGRRVRVDVLVATAMRTYFGQIAISRLNWEFSWDAAVPSFRTVTHLRDFSTVLRQTIEAPGGYLDRRQRAAKGGRYAAELVSG